MDGTARDTTNAVGPLEPDALPRRRPAGLLRRLISDESGAEILEYVLIAGLVIVATIAVIASFGTRVLARWTSVSGSSL